MFELSLKILLNKEQQSDIKYTRSKNKHGRSSESAKCPIAEPTTAWAAVSFTSASAKYSFLHLSGVGRTLWANSGEGSAQ